MIASILQNNLDWNYGHNVIRHVHKTVELHGDVP